MNISDAYYDTNESADPFGDLESVYSTFYYFLFFTEMLKIGLSFLSLAVDIHIVRTIYKAQEETTKTHKYIMHHAICHILLFVSSPIFHFILDLFNGGKRMYFTVMQIGQFSIISGFLFAIGLSLEWLIEVYNPQLKRNTQFLYFHSIVVCYIISIILFVILCFVSFHSSTLAWNHYTEKFLLIIANCVLIYCNYIKFRHTIILPFQKSCTLTIANTIIYSWTVLGVFYVSLQVTYGYELMHAVFLFLWFLPEMTAHGNTIIIILILGKYDDPYFGPLYTKMFRRSVRLTDDEQQLDGPINVNYVSENIINENKYV